MSRLFRILVCLYIIACFISIMLEFYLGMYYYYYEDHQWVPITYVYNFYENFTFFFGVYMFTFSCLQIIHFFFAHRKKIYNHHFQYFLIYLHLFFYLFLKLQYYYHSVEQHNVELMPRVGHSFLYGLNLIRSYFHCF
jgi:hypothetical protein